MKMGLNCKRKSPINVLEKKRKERSKKIRRKRVKFWPYQFGLPTSKLIPPLPLLVLITQQLLSSFGIPPLSKMLTKYQTGPIPGFYCGPFFLFLFLTFVPLGGLPIQIIEGLPPVRFISFFLVLFFVFSVGLFL